MDESAYTALYTGTYIFVFIIALSLTIFLFTEVVNYADVAYEFDENVPAFVIASPLLYPL